MSVDIRLHIITENQVNNKAEAIIPIATYDFETCSRLKNMVRQAEVFPLHSNVKYKDEVLHEDKYGGKLFYLPCKSIIDIVYSLEENDSGYDNIDIAKEIEDKWPDHYAVLFWC